MFRFSLPRSFSGLPPRIWLLSVVNFINRCGAMVLCFLTLYLTENLCYPITYAGYAMSCYGLGAIAGTFAGGRLVGSWGYQRVQLWSLLATGFLLLWVSQVSRFEWICVALFLLNLASESFRPANATAIRENSNAETFTRSASLMRMAFNFAIMFALTLGGWLIGYGWHYIFWADIATCWLSALLLWIWIPDTVLAQTAAPKASPVLSNEVDIGRGAVSPYRDTAFWHFAFCTFLGAFAFMQIIWTVPPFFKQVYHWNEFTIGIVCAINGLAVMLIEMPLIYRIEQRRPTIWFIRWGIVLYALAYLAFTLPVSLKWFAAVFYMLVISVGEILVMPFSSTWVARNTPSERQGDYWAIYGIAYSVANVLAPLVGTQIIDAYGYRVLWCFIAVVCGLAWVGFWRQSKITTLAPTYA
ncbi:MAG: MFS transporter [Chitinophagales bacterium]|nr:MFS transporter [Chitinophagales bacterium]